MFPLNCLVKARELATALETEVTAVLLGYQVSGLCEELAKYGADKIITVDDKALEIYTTEPYTHAMTQVIEHYKPALFSTALLQLVVIWPARVSAGYVPA